MSLILDGTNGLSDVDGSAATPAIRGSDANTGVFFGTDIVGLSTGGSERVRVDASGNVGIGTSSPGTKIDIEQSSSSGSTGQYPGIRIKNTNTSGNSFSDVQVLTGNGAVTGQFAGLTDGVRIAALTNHYLQFMTNSAERARIDSSGNLLLGTTVASSQTGTTIRPDGVIVSKGVYNTLVSASTRAIHMDSSGFFGYISSTRDSKTNINDLSNVNWLYQLNPVSFNYKKVDRETNTRLEEAEEETQYGLIAEDTAQVNDTLCFYDTTENGQELKGIAYEKLVVPMLKAIQEQQAIITALTARVEALEGTQP
jgi:hypothetical protein